MKVFFLSVLVSLQSFVVHAASRAVAIEGALSAVYEPYARRVFVAAGAHGVRVLEAQGESPAVTLPVTGSADEVARLGNHVAVVSSTDGALTVTEIDAQTLKPRRTVNVPHDGATMLAAAALNPDTLFLFMGNQGSFQGVVISLKEAKITQIVRPLITGLIYGKAVLSVRGTSVMIPGAYPGEIVSLDASDVSNVKMVARLRVHDWIHQVYQLSRQQAVVAGHLVGVQIVELGATGEEEEVLPSKTLLSDRMAHFLVRGGTLFAVSPTHFYVASLQTHEVQQTPFQPLSAGQNTVPIGLNEAGEVIVLELQAGVHFLAHAK